MAGHKKPTINTYLSGNQSTYLSVFVLAVVFLLISIRQVGRFRLKIWQIMLGGAVAVLLTGQISPTDAFLAINPGVMVFLFGMFVIGEAMVSSGYLSSLVHHIFSRSRTSDQLVLAILFGMGIFSAVLMNDTLAVIGTPLVLGVAASRHIRPRLLLLALAVAITTGSVMSPIGNPQNLLVALNSGMASPFVTFAVFLFVPTLISLGLSWVLLRLIFPEDFTSGFAIESPAESDPGLTRLVKISLAIILATAAVNIAGSVAGRTAILVPLPAIAVIAAVPILLFSPQRREIVRKIDWYTLLFFAAMFVLMESVREAGFFQSLIGPGVISSVPAILCVSVTVSQFISNVPFVALFQPLILQAGGTNPQLLAVAAGSTIAGNLTILGAASNVIIIQNAEKYGETITFWEFAKIGIPLTALQLVVYGIFLTFV